MNGVGRPDRVVDVDSHVTEPADLWTSRLSLRKWGADLPHVRMAPSGTSLGWYIGSRRIGQVPGGGTAGLDQAWKACVELHGRRAGKRDFRTFVEESRHVKDYAPYMGHPAAYDAGARLEWMDRAGIFAQVVYPNIAGFGGGFLTVIADRRLRMECLRTYNDFVAEWCAAGGGRLLPIAVLPFWDPPACAKEIARVAKLGHRGIVLPSEPESFGLPPLSSPAHDPIWQAASAHGLPVNFHIASNRRHRDSERSKLRAAFGGPFAAYAKMVALYATANMGTVAELVMSGLCHRFPDLRFVSVESGVGWLPFLLESLDWQWKNTGAHQEHPEYELLPSEFFRRQVFACFWFERASAAAAVLAFPDNILFETDFPHPGALVPHPLSVAEMPQEHIQRALAGVPTAIRRKVLWKNAAQLYGLA